MSLIIMPGREEEYEGAEWWQLKAVVNGTCYQGTNTEPVLVDAESPRRERAQWVLKPRGRLGDVRSMCELVGHRFAQRVGLPVVDFGIIVIPETLRSWLSTQTQDWLGESVGPNFATRYHPGVADLRSGHEVKETQRPVATEIYGWDVLVDNADRRITKSNILASDDALYAIDHELIFAWLREIGSAGPTWVASILHRLAREHFLCAHVPRWGFRLDGLRERVLALSPADLAEITAGIPSPWVRGEGAEALEQFRTYLKDVQARVAAILDMIDHRSVA
jgi:hypothetical protein